MLLNAAGADPQIALFSSPQLKAIEGKSLHQLHNKFVNICESLCSKGILEDKSQLLMLLLFPGNHWN